MALSWNFLSSVNSILTKRSDGPDRLQEDGSVDLSLDYRLTRKLSVGAFFSQDRYSAEKTESTTSNAGISTRLSFAGISWVQSVGAKFIDNQDNTLTQPDRSEQGINFSQTISWSPRILSGAQTDISLSQSLLELKKIPIHKRDLNISFSRCLNSSSDTNCRQDSIQVTYKEAWEKKRFFTGITQKKNRRDVNMSASRGIGLGVKLIADLDYLYDRDRRYSADQDSLYHYLLSSSLVADLRLERKLWERILVEGVYKYLRSEWNYLGEEGDQRMEGGELGGRIAAGLSRADSLYLTASVGVTSFFAPASGQFNDRDKLTVLAWGEYLHIFNSFLDMRLEGGFKNFHLTYMSEQNSYDNNHDQTYFLSPTFTWLPYRKLTVKQSYSIKANYRYYDYEKASESVRNSLLRRASSSSEVVYRYNEKMTFFAGYTYRYEDDGPLIWKDQWVQKISRDQRTNAISLSLDFRPARKFSISPRYTYEERKSWNHEAKEIGEGEEEIVKERRVLENRFLRKSISISLGYLVDQDNRLYLSAAHRLQDETQSSREISDYVAVSVAWMF